MGSTSANGLRFLNERFIAIALTTDGERKRLAALLVFRLLTSRLFWQSCFLMFVLLLIEVWRAAHYTLSSRTGCEEFEPFQPPL